MDVPKLVEQKYRQRHKSPMVAGFQTIMELSAAKAF